MVLRGRLRLRVAERASHLPQQQQLQRPLERVAVKWLCPELAVCTSRQTGAKSSTVKKRTMMLKGLLICPAAAVLSVCLLDYAMQKRYASHPPPSR